MLLQPGVRLHTYSGEPLGDDAFRARFQLEDDYLLATATVAQARTRVGLAPPRQQRPDFPDGRRRGPALVFHDVVRHLMGEELLTRSEQRIALQRAADAEAEGNEARRRQLRHDAEVWSQALGELDARGIDLSGGVPLDVVDALVVPDLGELLHSLQGKLRAAERDAGRRTFEHAARAFLDSDAFAPPPIVVLEGFTFFTPLQRRFIERCAGASAVHLIFPFHGEQSRAFRMMRRTYADWWTSEPDVAENGEDESGALFALASRLFEDDEQEKVPAGEDVTLTRHLHRHHEVAACIDRVESLLRSDDGLAPTDIAIVTRNPAEYQSLLQEEAALHGLEVTVGVPPRQLLLTPLGRFVLALYEVRDEHGLSLSPEAFCTILSSGWLGARAQRSADRFAAVTAQAFARCRTEREWRDAFRRLEMATVSPETHARMSTSHVAGDLEVWRTVLGKVDELSGRLFGGSPTSIGGHVRELLAALEALSTENLFEVEREVVERISEALEEAADATTLEMDAAEFGSVLAGLARERDTEEDASGGDDARTADGVGGDRVMVTTPEGIDGTTKAIVFYLGVDSRRVPRPFVDSWPIVSGGVDEHRDLERYLFLAVVRAATRALHLSFAEVAGDTLHGPSPFVAAVEDVLQFPDAFPPPPIPEPNAAPLVEHATGVARRERYRVEELATFGLCPFRYKLERLDRVAASYREPFHIGFLAQAAWIERTLREVAAEATTYNGDVAFRSALRTAMVACAPEVQAEFDGIRPLEWSTVERWTARDLNWIVDRLGVGTFRVQLLEAQEAGYDLPRDDRATYVDATPDFTARVGIIDKAVFRERERAQWLNWASTELDGEPMVELDGLRLFDEYYRAVRWMHEATFFAVASARSGDSPPDFIPDNYHRIRADAAGMIDQIEQGRYPRRAGDHCKYCPVQRECLGLNP